uniref:Uncharacterized protein n=1 Tax=Lactuca sativa TaxID=4236 RepID=A0A9R1V950_LACSA|nr:hypothetical protein LSAT_V11C600306560 [Lactuca sativa]
MGQMNFGLRFAGAYHFPVFEYFSMGHRQPSSLWSGVQARRSSLTFLFIMVVEGLHVPMEEVKEKDVFTRNTHNLIRILKCFELAYGLEVLQLEYQWNVQYISPLSLISPCKTLHLEGKNPLVWRSIDSLQICSC